MRRLLALSLVFTLLPACSTPALPATLPPPATSTPAPTFQPTQPLPSISHPDWAGGITHADGTTDSILLHLTDSDGTLTIQPQTKTLTITKLERTDSTISFVVGDLQFSGKLEGSQLTGEVTQAGPISSFSLVPLIDVTDSALAEYAGSYQFGSGEALAVTVSPSFTASGLDFFWQGLTLTNFATGAIRGLYPIAPDTFLVGSARVLGQPFAAQVIFARGSDGKVNSLLWVERDPSTGELGSSQPASRFMSLTETVRYQSADGITLVGQLTLPPNADPRAAIVMLHGSERGTRDNFIAQLMGTYFSSQGIALLTFDKRGVGESGGTYQEAASESNLKLLAQDVLAGVTYLKSRSELADREIGLMGGSQAGWIIPLAAQSNDVAFFIINSGPVVSVGQEDLYSSYTNDGESPTQFTPEQISAQLANFPPSGFDPNPILTSLTQPGLWLWGDQDKSIPVPESRANLEALITQGKTNFSYTLFANADHNLQQTTHGLFNEIPYSSGYPATYFSTLTNWLQRL